MNLVDLHDWSSRVLGASMLVLFLSPAPLLGQGMNPPPPPRWERPQISTGATAEGRGTLMEYGFELNAKTLKDKVKLVKSGEASELDFEASPGALRDYNAGWKMLRTEPAKAATRLQKAIEQSPNFVSAHVLLGLAYQGLSNPADARTQYELAAKLDPKYPGALVALGRMEMDAEQLVDAKANFEKAVALQPQNVGVLTMLCYTQHGTGDYRHAIETAVRVHGIDHQGMAMAHYLAGASATAMGEPSTAKREFELFLQEDPNNLLAATARSTLEALSGSAAPKPPQ